MLFLKMDGIQLRPRWAYISGRDGRLGKEARGWLGSVHMRLVSDLESRHVRIGAPGRNILATLISNFQTHRTLSSVAIYPKAKRQSHALSCR
jgi:hypothetical protein